jgi:hypothetical protein
MARSGFVNIKLVTSLSEGLFSTSMKPSSTGFVCAKVDQNTPSGIIISKFFNKHCYENPSS